MRNLLGGRAGMAFGQHRLHSGEIPRLRLGMTYEKKAKRASPSSGANSSQGNLTRVSNDHTKLPFTILIFYALFLSPLSLTAAVVWHPLPEEAYQFGEHYPEAQRLLFAFDYGHASIYEKLLSKKGMDPGFRRDDHKKGDDNDDVFEKELLTFILKILANPEHPKVKSEEANIAPNYVRHFPLVVDLFDWSHLLHQFVLDVMVTTPDPKQMEKRVNEIFEFYKANKAVAITDECKSMLFMDGHPYSKEFRRTFPSLNLLIWGYHWFQIKLYEALMNPSAEEQKKGVAKVILEFKEMISDLPDSADFDMMPSTFEEAPEFSKMFPRIAASFDNNHMLHDIVSDILTSDRVPISKVLWEGIKVGRMAWDPNAFRSPSCFSTGRHLLSSISPAAESIVNAKAAELALHRIEKLVVLKKIDEAYLSKFRRLSLTVIPEKSKPEESRSAESPAKFRIVAETYPAKDGTQKSLEILMNEKGKTLQNNAIDGGEPEGAPLWPDKDPVTLAENAMHRILDNASVVPELLPFFNTLTGFTISQISDAGGIPLAQVDVSSGESQKTLRIFISADGAFQGEQYLPQYPKISLIFPALGGLTGASQKQK